MEVSVDFRRKLLEKAKAEDEFQIRKKELMSKEMQQLWTQVSEKLHWNANIHECKYKHENTYVRGFQVVVVVKNPPPNARDIRHAASIPGWGRSSGGGRGNPL